MNPILAIPSFILIVIVICIRNFYLLTSTNIRRLEEIGKFFIRPKPLFTSVEKLKHSSTNNSLTARILAAPSCLRISLHGLSTIRAFGRQQIFVKQFNAAQDIHSSTWYAMLATRRWFSLQLDWLVVLYITLTTFSFMLIRNHAGWS